MRKPEEDRKDNDVPVLAPQQRDKPSKEEDESRHHQVIAPSGETLTQADLEATLAEITAVIDIILDKTEAALILAQTELKAKDSLRLHPFKSEAQFVLYRLSIELSHLIAIFYPVIFKDNIGKQVKDLQERYNKDGACSMQFFTCHGL